MTYDQLAERARYEWIEVFRFVGIQKRMAAARHGESLFIMRYPNGSKLCTVVAMEIGG